jgi:transposase
MNERRAKYPSDVSDEEWAFCVSYLTLMREADPQRVYPLREIFNGLQYLVKIGGVWRMMPHDLPPWNLVYQQTQRRIKAGCFQAMAHGLRAILRLALERKADPSAVILDSRILQSAPESGGRAGFDGHRKRKGSKVHAAVDTLGHLLPLPVTPVNEQDRAQMGQMARAVQAVVDEPVQIAFVDQGYTGQEPSEAVVQEGIQLEVVTHHEAKRGFVLLPRRRVVERSFAWAARFRRLARDYERLPATSYHFLQ